MIAPFLKLPIRGVIWYQGESNAMNSRAYAYGAVFETMIQDWRSKWKMPDLPFLYVQIASYSSGLGWAIVRDQQRRALHLANTGMAVAIDVGEEHQVHPAQKQPVGHRLALQALAISYGRPVVKDGPLFKEATVAGREIKVSFDSAAGLHAKDGPLGGFEVAGTDGVFAPATARIAGETVVVRSDTVANPVYVRYAWAGFPKVANLYNGADLPASPFTSQTPDPIR
jgi:sialate O-acetylesterase